jgi:4-hydroxybenzoate polyprenyltransferase
MRTRRYPRWSLPVFSLLVGIGCLVAFWAGGNLRQGLYSLAALAALGLVFLLGGRSETIRGLRGDGRDGYWQSLDLTATALAGLVLITLVIAMCFWEWAHGRDGSPYSQLGAITGVSYVVILTALRWRR